MTLVSVIIPTYNRSALLKQAIESVLAAERDDVELEILVVDDGSTDDTPEVVKNYPVVYLRQGGGLGPAGARNVGVAAARGEYITFLDDDDVWLPEKLTTHLRLFREHPEYAMALAQVWCCDSTLASRWGPFPDTKQTQLSIAELLRLDPQVGAMMVRRSVAQQFPFDRSLRWMEDLDWFLSLARGGPVGFSAVPVLLFRVRTRDTSELWLLYWSLVKVFRRQTRALRFSARLKLQPILWTWQRWYAWQYVRHAARCALDRHLLQSARALGCALLISMPQMPVLLARPARKTLASAPAVPTPQPLAPQPCEK